MENGFKKLEKNSLGCMYVATLTVSAIVLGILTGVMIYFKLFKYRILVVVFAVIVVAALINIAISPYFRYHRYRYRLDEDSMEIIEGYIFVSHNIVPIERIQSLELEQGPIDRFFGVSKLIITTGGSAVTVRFVSKEIIDMMSDGLKKKINQIVVEDKGENEDGEEC